MMNAIEAVQIPITGPADGDLLTKAELARAMRISTRTVDDLVARRAIPVLKLGTRTYRYSLPDVRAAVTHPAITV